MLRLSASLLVLASPAFAQTVRVVDATEKVYQGDATLPSPSTQATIYAAQNEFEGFQVVVTGPASNVSLSAGALAGPGGAQIAASNVRVYREVFMTLPAGSTPATDSAAKEGSAPDALVPQVDEFYGEPRNASVATVAAGQNAVFFVDIQVPQSATAGLYSGSITVNAGGAATTVPVALTVWPFALPSTPTLKSVIPFEWNAATAQYPSDKTCCGDTDAQMHLLHALLGVNHRVTIDSLDYGNADLTAYQRNFGAYINGTAATLLPGARPTVLRYGGGHGTSNTLATWRSFFQQNGWLDRLVDYAADEPADGANSTWCSLQANASADAANGVRSMTTAQISDALAATCNGVPLTLSAINVFIPVVDQLQPLSTGTGQSTIGNYSSWLSASLNGLQNEVWQYQSCDSWGCGGHVATGWPSYAIDHSAIRNRALEWISFRNGITGELYWDTTSAWVNSPKTPWTNQYATGGQGDGTLLYPGAATNAQVGGTHDIPIASLRLKMIREGVEDYEYMTALRSLGDGAYANAQVDGVFSTAHAVSGASPQALYAARYNIACRIVTDQHPGWTCDPATWGTGSTSSYPTLAVSLAGTGTGNVVSTPAGISCGSSGGACAAQFAPGTAVTLTATPDGAFGFTGFSGACSGAACALTLASSQSVTASFTACTATDCFARPDSATLGTSWNTYSGAIGISSGEATNAQAGVTAASVWQASVGRDQDVSADCKLAGAGSNCGVMARQSDANDFYYAYLDAGLGAVHLWRMQAGTLTHLGSATRTITAGGWYNVRLVAQGSALAVYFNNETAACISASDSALNGAYGGLHAYGGAAQAVWYGSFTIKTPPLSVQAPISLRAKTVKGVTLVRSLSLAVPSGTAAGDLLVATLFAGEKSSFTVTAPSGWTLAQQVAHGTSGLLRVYTRTATSGDIGKTYAWTASVRVSAALSMLAYAHASAVEASAARDNAAGSAYATPAVTTAASGDLLLAIHAGAATSTPPATWTTPAGMTQRASVGDGSLLSLAQSDLTQAAAGASGAFTATASRAESWALTALLALKH